jgi:hypothetical protein
MMTLTIPSLEKWLLQTEQDAAAARSAPAWPEESLRARLADVQNLRETTADLHQTLDDLLSEGVEARGFARQCGPLLGSIEGQIADVQRLHTVVSSWGDDLSQSLAAELCSLEQDTRALRDLLAEALARAAAPARPVDWERVRAAEEAYARGETKPFTRP